MNMILLKLNADSAHRRTTAVLWLAATLILLLGPPAGAALNIGDALPPLDQFQLEGKLPDALEGKVLLIDFWASWCAPCRQSFPALNDLQKRFSSQGVELVGVSVDEQRAAMERFLRNTPASFTVVRDSGQKLVAALDAQTMPTSIIIDAKGHIRFIHRGYHGDTTRKEYEKELELLLKEAK